MDTILASDDSKTPKRGDYIVGPDGSVTYNSTSDGLVTSNNSSPILTYTSYANTAGGVAITATQKTLQHGNVWLGQNLKYYPLEWGGNQYTGARTKVLNLAERFKLAGKVSFFIGLGFNGKDMIIAGVNKDLEGMGLAGIDAAFTVIGFYGGVPGMGVAVMWVVLSEGFKAYGGPLQPVPQEYNCHSPNY